MSCDPTVDGPQPLVPFLSPAFASLQRYKSRNPSSPDVSRHMRSNDLTPTTNGLGPPPLPIQVNTAQQPGGPSHHKAISSGTTGCERCRNTARRFWSVRQMNPSLVSGGQRLGRSRFHDLVDKHHRSRRC